MKKDLYRFFKSQKFSPNNFDNNMQQVMRLLECEDQFVDFLNDLNALLLIDKEPQSNSYFNFQAGNTLSGGPIPCNNFKCRNDRLIETANFSALYADTTALKSPLDDHFNRLFDSSKVDIQLLLRDIDNLFMLCPLIEKNIITFYSEYNCLCNDCYIKRLEKEKELDTSFSNIKRAVQSKLNDEIETNLFFDDERYFIAMEPNSSYGLDHEFHIITDDPSFLENGFSKKELDKIKNKEKILISKEQHNFLINNYVSKTILSSIFSDIYYNQLLYKDTNNTYLTTRSFDKYVIDSLNNKVQIKQDLSDNNLTKTIQHVAPFVTTSDFKTLVKIRTNDGESFQTYRNTLNAELKKFDFDSQTYNDFQRDIIQPQMLEIEKTISRNKKHLFKSYGKNIVSNAVIPGALFTIGQKYDIEILKNPGILGALPVSNAVSKIISPPESKTDKKDNGLFFLWNLEKKINK